MSYAMHLDEMYIERSIREKEIRIDLRSLISLLRIPLDGDLVYKLTF